MEGFLVKTLQKVQTKVVHIANKSAKKIPNLGMFCPQLGNVLSPTWERFIPTVGTSRSTNGNIKKGLLWIIEQAFVLLFVFYPRYLKLLPPTNSRMMLVGGISLSLMGIK